MLIDFFGPEYPYVDYFEFVNGRPTPWTRITYREAMDKVLGGRRPKKGAFISIQNYNKRRDTEEKIKHGAAKPGDEEDDLDREVAADDLSIGMFTIDIDTTPDDLETAQLEAIAVLSFFKTNLEVDHAVWPRVYFSGYKGFHLEMHPDFFGIKPSTKFHLLSKHAAAQISSRVGIEHVDPKIYSNRRIFRADCSRHEKSTEGFHKVELTHHELTNLSIDEIKKLAKKGRRDLLYSLEDYMDVGPEDGTVEFWASIVNMFAQQEVMDSLRPRATIKQIGLGKDEEQYPPCIKYILKNRPNDSERNTTTVALACFLKDQGIPEGVVKQRCVDWLLTHYDKKEKKHSERLANTTAVVRTAFNNDYHHVCKYVRSIPIGNSDEKIPCAGLKSCMYINDETDQDPEEIPVIPLSKASQSIYVGGTKVHVPIKVITKQDDGYIFPGEMRFTCNPPDETEICKKCSLGTRHSETWRLRANREMLALLDVSDGTLKSYIQKSCGANGKCPHLRMIRGKSKVNVVRVGIVPSVGHDNALLEDDKSAYVSRDAVYFGHDINTYTNYKASIKTYSDPKTQRMTHIIDKVEADMSDLDEFKPSPQMISQLREMFSVTYGTVKDKMDDIHCDLQNNVHQVWGRRKESIAIDLMWHSVLGFNIFGQPVKKGWFELVVLGDSGEGKNKLVEGFLHHYRVGSITSGEGSGRTSLAYAAQKFNDKYVPIWGLIPQNDRGLLIIDEMTGIPQDEMQKLTKVRNEGIVEAQGTLNGQSTYARTRLLFLTNPLRTRGDRERTMASYGHGIEAFRSLYHDAADQRRVDLCVGMKRDDVDGEIKNMNPRSMTSEHTYTNDMCRSLILWAWTRKPYQIKFVDDTEDVILRVAREQSRDYETDDVYLVSASDQKYKLARISCAVAARVFSTNDAGTDLLVKPEHVRYANLLMRELYNSSALEYNKYARRYKMTQFIAKGSSKAFKDAVMPTLRSPNEEVFQKLVEYLYMQGRVRANDLKEMFTEDAKQYSIFQRELLGSNLLILTSGNLLQKSAKLTSILKELLEMNEEEKFKKLEAEQKRRKRENEKQEPIIQE